MKAGPTALYLAIGALVALLILPGAAAAAGKPVSRATPPAIDQKIVERGSNGFFVEVGVHDRRLLTLTASRYGHGLAFEEAATYKMPVRLRPGSTAIKARLGKLGRVDMRFVPENVKEVRPSRFGCKGDKVVEEEGLWVGLLAFHGESGFTQVRVHGAPGTVTKTPPLRCRQEKAPNLKKLRRELEALEKQSGKAEEEDAEDEEKTPALKLEATARRHRVAFVIARAAFDKGHKRSSISSLAVAANRRRGRIEETGSVLALFTPGSYLRPADSRDPTAEAIVKLRAPFSGSAVYRTHPKAPPSWTGDLKVMLPGFGDVRLTGKGTHAAACESLFASCLGRPANRASDLLLERPVPKPRNRHRSARRPFLIPAIRG